MLCINKQLLIEEDYKAGRIYTQAEVDKLVATWLH